MSIFRDLFTINAFNSYTMIKVILVFISLSTSAYYSGVSGQDQEVNYNKVSEDLLNAIKNGESTDTYTKILESSTIESLEAQLTDDTKKLAFWINVYNSYIIMVLQEHPEYYDDRKKFFKAPHITIGGENVSFADIEHGIIRRSQWDLGLGLIRKPFPGKWERKLRVSNRDYRIHFALNCGAKACPPVTVYDPDNLEAQFEYMTTRYLNNNTTYDEKENKVTTTPLFSWFRGDFGCKKGVKKILAKRELIPSKKVDLKFKGYDWTLDIDNFVEVPE